MVSLNIWDELCVYERYPKLCEHILEDYAHRARDDYVLEYLEKLGYQIIYTKDNNGIDRFVSFLNDVQHLEFSLKHS
jgi:hypothetical protein